MSQLSSSSPQPRRNHAARRQIYGDSRHGYEQESSYILPANSAAEIARLANQDRFFNEAHQLIPPAVPENGRVLDLGCGAGAWCAEVAFHHRKMEVIGIDISRELITYATASARTQMLDNVHFEVMDIREKFAFEDGSFDLVNARFMSGFLQAGEWPTVIGEMVRVTRPGGIVRLIDTDGNSVTSSPAGTKFRDLIVQTMQADGRTLVLTPYFKFWLREAGCSEIQLIPHLIDISTGEPAHPVIYEDFKVLLTQVIPYLVARNASLTEEMLTDLLRQALGEMLQDSFRGHWPFVECYGRKA
ncbi:MAG TPA: methyltransferase domain-containing protein [Ktedonobacteraceae bacterium]|nr:methyltransferase domain-containing protein [Ktedonobacteraceae bacterium]